MIGKNSWKADQTEVATYATKKGPQSILWPFFIGIVTFVFVDGISNHVVGQVWIVRD